MSEEECFLTELPISMCACRKHRGGQTPEEEALTEMSRDLVQIAVKRNNRKKDEVAEKTPEQILMGGKQGPPDAFKRVQKGIPLPAGTTVGGFIEEWETAQSTNIKTGERELWPDGNKKMELRVTIQTDLREPHRYEEDDGKRRFFIKESTNMQRAVMSAVVDAGADFIERGGHLTVTYGGPDPAYAGNDYPPIVYTAVYRQAAQGVLMGQGNNGAAQPAVAAQPVPDATAQAQANLAAAGVAATPIAATPPPAAPAPVAAPAAPAISPELAAKIAHLSPEQQAGILKLSPEQRASIGFGD